MNGSTLANYSVYKKLDYIILIDAPFVERQKRVIERNDQLLNKSTLVSRDQGFRTAVKRGEKSGKSIDKSIKNAGTIEELRLISDAIYKIEILGEKNDKEETMNDKYGGYKVITPKMGTISRDKGDWDKSK